MIVQASKLTDNCSHQQTVAIFIAVWVEQKQSHDNPYKELSRASELPRGLNEPCTSTWRHSNLDILINTHNLSKNNILLAYKKICRKFKLFKCE
jgi:hypothetical protein